ncbi:MAG TPA: DNA recombination/repair protein RecA, partial [Ignavibacteria bacterium]|nr:DNA recombination/repair protein RecA [Ignavibacteria bacterium]
DVRRIAQIKDGTNVIGNRTKVKVVKNKVAPPFREVEFDIIYNEGISKLGDLVDTAVDMEIIKKAGAWFSYNEQRMQGREGVKNMLIENPELLAKLNNEVREAMGMDVTSESTKKESAAASNGTNGESKPKEKASKK